MASSKESQKVSVAGAKGKSRSREQVRRLLLKPHGEMVGGLD